MTNVTADSGIDDNKEIHEDFRKSFAHPPACHDDDLRISKRTSSTMPRSQRSAQRRSAKCVSTRVSGQGRIAAGLQAAQEGQPHVMAFVDVRMPPGIERRANDQAALGESPELTACSVRFFGLRLGRRPQELSRTSKTS